MITSNQIKNILELYRAGEYRPNIQICIPGSVVGASKSFIRSLENFRQAASQDRLVVNFATWDTDRLNYRTYQALLEEQKKYPNLVLNTTFLDVHRDFKHIVEGLLNRLNVTFDEKIDTLFHPTLKKVVFLYTMATCFQNAYRSLPKFTLGPEFPIDTVFLKMSVKTILTSDIKLLEKNLTNLLEQHLNNTSRHLSKADYLSMNHSFDMISTYLASSSGIGDISFIISPEKAVDIFGCNIDQFKAKLYRLYENYFENIRDEKIDLSFFQNYHYNPYNLPFEGSTVLKDFIDVNRANIPYISNRNFLSIFEEVRGFTTPPLMFENGSMTTIKDPTHVQHIMNYYEYGNDFLIDHSELRIALSSSTI